ncbi:asparagine synthase (glutamine-hydrolyzing) [Commensalibacter sp. ESL0382]|uniref:asparagine synthase (glutamine-hydrolyzing) n=1 Tax=Commensalibacter sp. ESL0382 TaxID=2676445 RepID=UPI0012D9EAEA|nr:asparagine synthase (glutamine-hydrolyzing) [Commensalibacter sp. ESL0382]MUG34357.1 asparagine synthase (glutamine-hydrolyzing) [Commensalibacter sp. ESL0382]
MCGIAGIALKDGHSISEHQKKILLEALHHRGPDGNGSWENSHVVLLHSRLSIIDIEGGKQPLSNDSQQVLIANGEIYNSLELRHLFKNYIFKTGSDCEVILPLWQKFHADYVNSLRGMYGVAMVDIDEKTLVLSRDPFGIKPLYYASVEQGVVFASEAQAIIKAGFVRHDDINQSAVDTLLQLQFIPGHKTIYNNIYRILPGETLIIRNGEIIHRQTQSCFPKTRSMITDEKKALNQLDSLLEDSIRIHERSDVPFGLFLSSGVDSSIILKMMQRLGRINRLHAWTARFEINNDSGYVKDEALQAALLAKEIGIQHHCVTINQQDVFRHLPKIIACMDDPVADYAIIPTWFLANEARSIVKVILSGEGGDELFAGYGRYRKAAKSVWLGGKRLYRKGIFERDNFFLHSVSSEWQDYFRLQYKLQDKNDSRLKNAQKIDMNDWLPNDLLIKLDRCLMAHSIEGRVPFLDKKIAAFAFNLEDHLKIRNGQGKWILRKWLEWQFPLAQPFAKKSGFSVPIGLWIEQHANELAQAVFCQTDIGNKISLSNVRSLFEKASGRKERFMAWNILFYAIWHQVHIVGKNPLGNVLEVLMD